MRFFLLFCSCQRSQLRIFIVHTDTHTHTHTHEHTYFSRVFYSIHVWRSQGNIGLWSQKNYFSPNVMWCDGQDCLMHIGLVMRDWRFSQWCSWGFNWDVGRNVPLGEWSNKYTDIVISQNTIQFYAQYVQCISQLHVSAHFRPSSGGSLSLASVVA